jgi:dTDP-4-amino-4,6-dideoxygalactose transaminase
MHDPEILAALERAFREGTLLPYHAGHVAELESLLAEAFQVNHALTCCSGTLAVEVGLRALKVGPGDEVILAAYDYEANFLTVHALGAKPVLVDVASHHFNLDPAQIYAAVSPQTKAILVSHLHGGLVSMRRVREIAREHRLAVLEDAAQAAGAIIEGRPAGSWGDVGVLSFGGSKLLAAGRGGAILTSNPELFQRAKLVLSRGVQQWAALSELQAIVLKPQLLKLRERTELRQQSVQQLASMFADLKGLKLFENHLLDSVSAFYKVGFQFDEQEFGCSREQFVQVMHAQGIPFDPGFKALHLGRSPNRFRAVGTLHQAERAHRSCVKLHHPILLGSNSQLQQVANAVRSTYRKS